MDLRKPPELVTMEEVTSSGSSQSLILNLSYQQHLSYYRALENNDVSDISRFIAESGRKAAMLNGWFDYGEEETLIPQTHLSRLSRPLFLAAMMGSVEVVELLIKKGADVHQQNCYSENIIHSLVAANSLDFITDGRALKLFRKLVTMQVSEELGKLLFQENVDGLRPVEMAANLGCITLYEAIHLSPNVYVTKVIEKGSFTEQWVDVTEYETCDPGNRKYWGLIGIFSFLEKEIVFTGRHGDILKCNIINLWIKQKLKSIRVPLTLSFILSLTSLFSFTIFVTNGMNLVSEPVQDMAEANNQTICVGSLPHTGNRYLYFRLKFAPSLVLVVLIFGYCILHGMTHTVSLMKESRRREKLFRSNLCAPKHMVVSYKFYKYFDMCTNIAVCLTLILTFIGSPILKSIISILVALTCVTSMWGVLFFLQTSSLLGHFTIAMQRMVSILV